MIRDNNARVAGRPRDDAISPALLDATRRLVSDRGYSAVTIAMVAEEAGVSRQTLYRRWPSKADLVLDAFLASAAIDEVFEEGPLSEVLFRFLSNLFANMKNDGPAIRNLIASAQIDPAFMRSFRERFVEPRAEIMAGIIRKGASRGEVSGALDMEVLMDCLHGAFWYRLLLGKQLDDDYARRMVASCTPNRIAAQ